MWFVILKTLLPGDPGARSAQRRCCSARMTPVQHTRIHARCQSARRLSYRYSTYSTARCRLRSPSRTEPKKTSTRVAADTNATLGAMGYRGEDVSARPEPGERQPPWQSAPAGPPAAVGASYSYGPGGYAEAGQPGQVPSEY